VPRFLAFFENIPSSEFIKMARDIIAEVDKLKPERDRILRELEQALLYSNFPGNCQYLGQVDSESPHKETGRTAPNSTYGQVGGCSEKH